MVEGRMPRPRHPKPLLESRQRIPRRPSILLLRRPEELHPLPPCDGPVLVRVDNGHVFVRHLFLTASRGKPCFVDRGRELPEGETARVIDVYLLKHVRVYLKQSNEGGRRDHDGSGGRRGGGGAPLIKRVT